MVVQAYGGWSVNSRALSCLILWYIAQVFDSKYYFKFCNRSQMSSDFGQSDVSGTAIVSQGVPLSIGSTAKRKSERLKLASVQFAVALKACWDLTSRSYCS